MGVSVWAYLFLDYIFYYLFVCKEDFEYQMYLSVTQTLFFFYQTDHFSKLFGLNESVENCIFPLLV